MKHKLNKQEKNMPVSWRVCELRTGVYTKKRPIVRDSSAEYQTHPLGMDLSALLFCSFSTMVLPATFTIAHKPRQIPK